MSDALKELTWMHHEGAVHSIDVDVNSHRIVTASGWWLSLWDSHASQHPLVGAINCHPQSLNVVRFDPRGCQIAFGGDVGYVGIVRKLEGQGWLTLENTVSPLPENWQMVSRLLGHISDVVDVAWQSEEVMASASLDNTIIIWDVMMHRRLRMCIGHGSFVKAIAWDPRGEYLASISDDRSLIIWRDSAIVHRLTKPFEKSPVSSCGGMKIDWSPDGSKVAAVHATKTEKIQLCALIDRTTWSYEYRGIEGQGSITIAKFNPFGFIHDGRKYHYWVSGGTVGTIGIWREPVKEQGRDKDKKLLLAVTVEGPIMDLCWCPDGYSLLVSTPVSVMQWKLNSSTLGQRQSLPTRKTDRCPEIQNQQPKPSSEQPAKRQVTRKTAGKRIVPQKLHEDVETTPGKRRRVGSLHYPKENASNRTVRASFIIQIRSRRSNKYKLQVVNDPDQMHSRLCYQELGMTIWSLVLSHRIQLGIANDSFLCLLTVNQHLLVFDLKSGSLLLPATLLDVDVAFIDCDKEITLMLCSTDCQIELWDLKTLQRSRPIQCPLRRLLGMQKDICVQHAAFTDTGELIVQSLSGSYSYCKKADVWTETEIQPTQTEASISFLSTSWRGTSEARPLRIDDSEKPMNRDSSPSNDVTENAISSEILSLEEAMCQAQRDSNSGKERALFMAVMRLIYTLLHIYNPRHKWTGRKIVFYAQSILQHRHIFPERFRRAFIKELWSMTKKENLRYKALQVDLVLTLQDMDIP